MLSALMCCTTVQAQRITLAELQAQLAQLSEQLEAIKAQSATNGLAKKQCPTGLAVVGFDHLGEPECGAPWPDAPLPELFDFNFTCERQFDEAMLNQLLENSLNNLPSQIAQSLEQTYDMNIITITFENVSTTFQGDMRYRSFLQESAPQIPCADELSIRVIVEGFTVEGELSLDTGSSLFTYQADMLQVDLQAELESIELSTLSFPASIARNINQLTESDTTFVNDVFEMENEDAFPDAFKAVGLNTITGLISNNLSDLISQEADQNIAPIIANVPTPVTVHFSSK